MISQEQEQNHKQEFIEILKQLEYYNKNYEKQNFKAKIYREAQDQIKQLNKLSSTNDIKDLPGIGKAIVDKLNEFIETNQVKNLEQLKTKYGIEEYQQHKTKQEKKDVFMQIHGIGDAAAEKIIDQGITTIEQLKKNKDKEIPGKGKKPLKLLNPTQQKGLEYYEQVLERIPRQEIKQFEMLLNQEFKKTQNQLDDLDSKFEIVGSYRRNRPDSGDIDIIITSNKNNKAIYDKFLNNLNNVGIIKAFLSKGDIKSMVVAKLNEESIARRVDFLYSPPDEYAFAILYFTGSKEFNTAMRQHALTQNLTLNEHGFHMMENNLY